MLGEDDVAYRQRLEERWGEYFSGEAEEPAKNDELTRSICTATAKDNKESGYASETWLGQLLRDRYPLVL